MTWNLKALSRSRQDRKIAGICGGFGAFTPVPSWIWRAAFLAAVVFYGFGVLTYLILWVCMPIENGAR